MAVTTRVRLQADQDNVVDGRKETGASVSSRILGAWERTAIGGKAASKDFLAKWLEVDVGRSYLDQGTSHSDGTRWFWTMTAHLNGKGHGGDRGREEGKQPAAAQVELAFTKQLAREAYSSRS